MSSTVGVCVVSAFAAHPHMPSEPGVGWRFIEATLREASKRRLEVVIVTTARSAEAIEPAIREAGFANIARVLSVRPFVDFPFFRWEAPKWTRIEHLLWTLAARGPLRDLERSSDVLYAHHVTFATELLPPPIVWFSSQVFRVWGPVGAGGVAAVFRVPPVTLRSRAEYWKQLMRDVVARIPAGLTSRRVDAIWAQNSALSAQLRRDSVAVTVFPNVIVSPPGEALEARECDATSLLCVGHFVPRKRFEVALRLLLEPRLSDWTLHFVGGPVGGRQNTLATAARRLGVSGRVHFHGKLSRESVLGLMRESAVLFHPSAREGASGVVGEATAMGLPVVCFDGTGAASVLEASGASGVRVDASTATIESLSDAVLLASSLPRLPRPIWTEGRLQAQLQRRIFDMVTGS